MERLRFLVAAKSAAPQCARRYYLMAKHDGVDIDEGSVAYSDNEVIFKSIEWGMAVDDSNAIQKFSAMYDPWVRPARREPRRPGPHRR
jgi:hypothetical protein